jgi:hypothetical protein
MCRFECNCFHPLSGENNSQVISNNDFNDVIVKGKGYQVDMTFREISQSMPNDGVQ